MTLFKNKVTWDLTTKSNKRIRWGENMNTSEFCQTVNTTRDTLRFYDQKKLLVPKRTSNNYRFYSKDDIQDFRIIRNLQNAGLLLSDIKMILLLKHKPVTKNCHEETLRVVKQRNIEFQKQIDFYKSLQDITQQMIEVMNDSDNTDLEILIDKLGDVKNTY